VVRIQLWIAEHYQRKKNKQYAYCKRPVSHADSPLVSITPPIQRSEHVVQRVTYYLSFKTNTKDESKFPQVKFSELFLYSPYSILMESAGKISNLSKFLVIIFKFWPSPLWQQDWMLFQHQRQTVILNKGWVFFSLLYRKCGWESTHNKGYPHVRSKSQK
jgi:hypothetical protein